MKKHTLTIAEIGLNHNSDMDITKKLIDIASFAGFDFVKFQKRNPIISTPEHQKNKKKQTPWGEMTYLDYKIKMEFGKAEFDKINKYCKEKGISWFASVWDKDSVDFMSNYTTSFKGVNQKVMKIPSAHVTNNELLEYARKKSDILMISTGMSTEIQIESAFLIGKPDILFHTNSSYPTNVKDLNMSYIKHLKEKYPNTMVGYSGHEYGLTTSMASIYLGAEIIERHVTLDKSMWGSDQMASVEPHGMIKLIKGIRELEIALGTDENRTIGEEEMVKLKSLRK